MGRNSVLLTVLLTAAPAVSAAEPKPLRFAAPCSFTYADKTPYEQPVGTYICDYLNKKDPNALAEFPSLSPAQQKSFLEQSIAQADQDAAQQKKDAALKQDSQTSEAASKLQTQEGGNTGAGQANAAVKGLNQGKDAETLSSTFDHGDARAGNGGSTDKTADSGVAQLHGAAAAAVGSSATKFDGFHDGKVPASEAEAAASDKPSFQDSMRARAAATEEAGTNHLAQAEDSNSPWYKRYYHETAAVGDALKESAYKVAAGDGAQMAKDTDHYWHSYGDELKQTAAQEHKDGAATGSTALKETAGGFLVGTTSLAEHAPQVAQMAGHAGVTVGKAALGDPQSQVQVATFGKEVVVGAVRDAKEAAHASGDCMSTMKSYNCSHAGILVAGVATNFMPGFGEAKVAGAVVETGAKEVLTATGKMALEDAAKATGKAALSEGATAAGKDAAIDLAKTAGGEAAKPGLVARLRSATKWDEIVGNERGEINLGGRAEAAAKSPGDRFYNGFSADMSANKDAKTIAQKLSADAATPAERAQKIQDLQETAAKLRQSGLPNSQKLAERMESVADELRAPAREPLPKPSATDLTEDSRAAQPSGSRGGARAADVAEKQEPWTAARAEYNRVVSGTKDPQQIREQISQRVGQLNRDADALGEQSASKPLGSPERAELMQRRAYLIDVKNRLWGLSRHNGEMEELLPTH